MQAAIDSLVEELKTATEKNGYEIKVVVEDFVDTATGSPVGSDKLLIASPAEQ